MGLSKKGEFSGLQERLPFAERYDSRSIVLFLPLPSATDARTREQKQKEAAGIKVEVTKGGVRFFPLAWWCRNRLKKPESCKAHTLVFHLQVPKKAAKPMTTCTVCKQE